MIFASLHQVEDAGRRIAAVDLSLHQEIASSPQGAEEGGKQWLCHLVPSTFQAVLPGGRNVLVTIWGGVVGLTMEEKLRARWQTAFI